MSPEQSDNVLARALTIAGSDTTSGAGLQADLMTFAAFGVLGASVATAITAQSSQGVEGVWHPEPEAITGQLAAATRDGPFAAAKIGMLGRLETLNAVADALDRTPIEKLIVDPVLISTSGRPLLEPDALHAFINRILPKAFLITPNLAEAEALSGLKSKSPDFTETAARKLVELGARAVLITGGHGSDPERCVDVLFDGERITKFEGPRMQPANVHGTGCALSAAITAGLTLGHPLAQAIEDAKRFVERAIAGATNLGETSHLLDLDRPAHTIDP